MDHTHALEVTTANDDQLEILVNRPGMTSGEYAAELAARLTKGSGLYGPCDVDERTWAIVPGHSISAVHVSPIAAATDYQPSHAVDESSAAGDPAPSTVDGTTDVPYAGSSQAAA